MISVVVCKEEGCPKPAKARGWCRSHYEKWLRCGDPAGVRPYMMRGSPEERFWGKVDKRGLDECWKWLAAKDAYGYGIFSVWRADKGRYMNMLAHRFSYVLHGGDLPLVAESGRNDRVIDHTCQNMACVNPKHMEVVTHEENARRARLRMAVSEQAAAVACAVVQHRTGRITTGAVAEELGVTRRRAGIAMNKLREQGFLRAVKNGSRSYWEILEEAA